MRKPSQNLVLVSSLALFSMFFGAGNLIFPPTLGRMAGDAFIVAELGFLMTSVGIVLLAVIATTRAGGNVEDNARPFGRVIAGLFGTAILLAIGPGLAIPRTAATTYEILDLALFPGLNPIISSVVFFAIVLFFALNPKNVIDSLGKLLTPLLLILLTIIIIKVFVTPLGVPVPTGMENVFSTSFEEGYQTMDGLAALAFTSIIIAGYRQNGVGENALVSMTIKAGVFAAIALSFVYAGLLYAGATTSGLDLGEMTRVELLFYISDTLLGSVGKWALAGAMSLACLTTAIGLTASVGSFFERITHGRLKYGLVAILSTLFSAFFAVYGVESIVIISAPILVFMYPIAMTLIILNLLSKDKLQISTFYGATIGAFTFSVLSFIEGYVELPFMTAFRDLFPTSIHSFLWILFALVFAFLFTIGARNKETI